MTKKILTVIFTLGLLMPTLVFAAPLIKTGDKIGIEATQPAADDAYMVGRMLTLTGKVAGDFLGVGGNLFIDGATTGDVIVAGGEVTVVGSVGDDLRVAGGNITISSTVGDYVLVGGGQVNIVSGAIIGGDLIVGGGQVTIDGIVKGSVRSAGGDISINGTVMGDVFNKSGHIVIGPKAKITGALNYSSTNKAEIHDGAVIAGPVNFTEIAHAERSSMAGIFSIMLLLKLLALFVSALVIQWAFKRIAVEAVTNSWQHVWHNLGRGFVSLIIIPIVAGILAVTIIGIPFALVLMFSYFALMTFSCLFVSVFLGGLIRKFYKKSDVFVLNWKTALLGSLATVIVALIPFVGGLIVFLAFLTILGMFVKMKIQYVKNLRQPVM